MPDIESEKLQFEREKWCESKKLEKLKLWLQVASTLISATAIAVPLVVVAVTIYASIDAQTRQSRADFDLKAAQVVLEPESVTESQNRASGLAAMFPERFPADLPSRLQPLRDKLETPPTADSRALLNLLVAAPKEKRKEILELWLAFYPDDRDLLPQAVISLLENP